MLIFTVRHYTDWHWQNGGGGGQREGDDFTADPNEFGDRSVHGIIQL